MKIEKVKYFPVVYSRRTYCVYVHENKINGRKYFGITKGYPKDRWGHGSGYVKCTKFYPAIKKYGWDGFHHIVIVNNLSEEEATYLEKSFIKIFNTTNREFGYNTDKGGKLSSISAKVKRKMIAERRMRPIICLETMQRYESQADLSNVEGKSHSYVHDACKSKGSRVHNGKHYLYIEDYIKMSPREIQDIIDGKFQNHQEVVCMETGEVFWDATKAGQTLSYGKFSVSNRCNHFRERGKDNFAGGFHWAFKEDYEKLSPEEIERIINLDNFRVVCIETKKIYENPIIASKETKADEGCIRRCCKGILRHAGNLHWMYEKDYKKATPEDIEKLFNKPRKIIESIRIKEIICLETKKVYRNMTEAAQSIGASQAAISKSCKLGDGFQSGGFHWMFKEDYDKATPEEIQKRLKKRKILSKRAKPVVCLETKKEYRCANEVTGLSKSNIVACCLYNSGRCHKLRKRYFLVGGYHWLYKEDYERFSEEKIQEIIKSNKEACKKPLKKSKFIPKTKEVINISTMEIYKSVKDAGKHIGCHPDSVREACLKKHHTLFGELWLYKEEYDSLSQEKIQKLLNNMNKSSFKKIICLETKEIFKGATEACKKYTSTNPSCISSCCTGNDTNRLTAGGLHWMYYKDYLKTTPEEIQKKLNTKQGQKVSKAVIKLETLEVYPSIEDASAKTGISSKTIRYSCTGKRMTHHKKGHWMFKKDYDKATPEEIQERFKQKRVSCNRKKVRCVETGKVFNSVMEANEFVGGCPNNSVISKCCKNPNITYKGFHWEYVDK